MKSPAAGTRTIGRLLRLSLAPSAAADVAAGTVLGAGFWPGGAGPWLLIAASLSIYHGGMALNDWADRAHDAATRSDRPIPSGRVPAGAAALLGFALLVAGPWIALGADRSAAYVLAGVAVLAAAYDLFGRGPVLGPLLLGLCRAGNLGAGIVFGRAAGAGAYAWETERALFALVPGDLAIAAVYGGYVVAVSFLGRLEDGEDERPLGRRPSVLIAVAAGLLLSLPIVPPPELPSLGPGGAWVPPPAEVVAGFAEPGFLQDNRITLATVVAALGAFGLLRLAFRTTPWTRTRVMQAMGMALRRLLVFTATAALLRGTPAGLAACVAILAGYPVSFALRKVFPPS
jgi:4-hydroxybenzoate polyprenyltransferase